MSRCCARFLVCLYICVREFLLQNNIAGLPSSQAQATFGFPQYCTSTCVRFGCTWNASCVDTKPKKKKLITNFPSGATLPEESKLVVSLTKAQHSQTSLNSSKTDQEDPCGSTLMQGQQTHWLVQYCFRSGNAKDPSVRP